MFLITDAYAQTAAATDMGSLLASFLPMVLLFVVFWFFLIRPQQKRQKEHAAMVQGLAVGDEIMTAGGITGRVLKLDDMFVEMQIAEVHKEKVTLMIQRMSIQAVLPKGTITSF